MPYRCLGAPGPRPGCPARASPRRGGGGWPRSGALALDARLVQLARDGAIVVGLRKRNDRSSSSHLTCQMPRRLASGQRPAATARQYLRTGPRDAAYQRRVCSRDARRSRTRAGRARTRAASCARARSARRGQAAHAASGLPRTCPDLAPHPARRPVASGRSGAERAGLDREEFARRRHQGYDSPKALPPLLGLAQVVPGVDQWAAAAHLARAPMPGMNRRDALGGASASSPVSSARPRQQRLGEGARARPAAPPRPQAAVPCRRTHHGSRCTIAAARLPPAQSSRRAQKLPHRCDLVGGDERRRMAHAGEFVQRAFGPHRHRVRRCARQQVVSAPRSSRTGHDAVVARPQRRLAGGGERPASLWNGTAIAGS